MKIINVSPNEMELREGGATGIVIGIAVVAAAVIAGIFLIRSHSSMIWVAPVLGVAGIVAILFSSSITVNANRASGQLRYQKKRLVGTQNSTYSIADVFRIETRKQWRMQNEASTNDRPATQQPVLVAQSVIVFRDGQELALDHLKTSSSTSVGSTVLMGGQGAETAMAAQVAQFLNVPFQEIAPPNMGIGINIIQS